MPQPDIDLTNLKMNIHGGWKYRSDYKDGDAPPEAALKLITSNNFESGLGNVGQTHAGITRYALTNSNPHSGTQCLRMNLRDATASDPITNLQGSGIYTANWPGSPSQVPNVDQYTWEFWYRFDDCDWKVTAENPQAVNMKLFYFLSDNYSDLANTFYLAGGLANGGTSFLAISYNGGSAHSNWWLEPWAWKNASGNPLQTMFMQPVMGSRFNAGADGQWHKVKLEIIYNFDGLGYSKWRVSVDGFYLFDSDGSNRNVSPDGWFNMPNFRVRGARLTFTENDITSNATDRTGHACGVQWDDLVVYEGVIE